MQGKYPLLFGNYQGEVLNVSEGSGANGNAAVKYDVLVTFTNGSQQVITGVQMGSMFGGIGDTFQAVLLGTNDIQTLDPADYYSDDAHRSTTGARVIIVFLAGHIQYPVITGFLNHPKGIRFYKDHESLDPQANLTYKGMTWQINDQGEFEIIHRGPPTVSYAKGGGLLGAAAGALSAVSSLEGGDDTLPPTNPALEPDDTDNTVRMKFLANGGWRLNDAVGQMIELDHEKNRIYISNNDLKSTEDQNGGPASGGNQLATNSTDAEYILWDFDKQLILINARSTLQLYSFDKRKDVTEGDHTHHVKSDEQIKIDGDKTDTYGGAWTFSVEDDYKPTVSGDAKWAVTGDFSVETDGDTKIKATGDFTGDGANITLTAESDFTAKSGGASLTMNAAGQIALKGNQGEVLALIGQILQAILALTVPTSPGGGPSGPPINSSDFAQLQAKFQGMAG